MSISLPFHRLRLFGSERFNQRERDIHRLIIFRLSARDVARQSSNCTTRRRHQKFFTGCHSRRVQPGQPAHRHRFDVAFDASDLSSEEDVWMLAHLHGWPEYARGVDISVPMNLTELKKLRVFESGNHS